MSGAVTTLPRTAADPPCRSTAPELSDTGDSAIAPDEYDSAGQDPNVLLMPPSTSYKVRHNGLSLCALGRLHFSLQLDHHLYTTPLPHTSNLPASHLPLHAFFIPDDIRHAVVDRAHAKLASAPADAALPAEVHVYHSLHALVSSATLAASPGPGGGPGGSGAGGERSARVFGFLTECYRATCRLDGRLYCLRRIQGASGGGIACRLSLIGLGACVTGFKLAKEGAFAALDKWRRIRHPNIVSIREAFTTRLFSDACERAPQALC